MAPEQQVKRYLAYWFQLGKRVLIRNGDAALQPQSVMAGDRYSDEFESIWQQIVSPDSGDCYLEGTHQTITELLTPEWNVEACSRCEMPVPVKNAGMPPELCPCNDLPNWPNMDLPLPREPISSQDRLQEIRDRLNQGNAKPEHEKNVSQASTTQSQTPSDAVQGQRSLREIRDRLQNANRS
ncbi:MAG TPA: hypothetical protein V6D14_28770 [Coleofasciculaceae cyanobacterium]|jgi:hypothetical protein